MWAMRSGIIGRDPPVPSGRAHGQRPERQRRAGGSRGPLIRELVEKDSYLVVDQSIVPDDQKTIEEALIRLADQVKVDLILTTGGTAFPSGM